MMQKLKEYTPDDLKHLKDLEMKILKEVISICERHGLKYYAYGGTMLGAVRHGGFIPWDDDIDIAMFRKDYKKLLKILDTELSDEYYVLNFYKHEEFYYSFTQVCLKGTELRPYFLMPVSYKPGICIDIFPIDNVPESEIKRKIYYSKYPIFYHLIRNSIFKVKTSNKINSCIHSLIHSFLKIYPGHQGIIKRFDRYLTKYNDKNTNYVTVHISRDEPINFGKNGFFDKRDFEPSRKVKFEDIEIYVPYNYDRILTIFYGDYMTLPPEEKRYNHAPEVIDFGEY